MDSNAKRDSAQSSADSATSNFCRWSSGGAEYAKQSLDEFGSADIVIGFLPKTHVLLDDQNPDE